MAAVPAGLLTVRLLKTLTNSKSSVDPATAVFLIGGSSSSQFRNCACLPINISLTLGLF
jgi:hypothetical protein